MIRWQEREKIETGEERRDRGDKMTGKRRIETGEERRDREVIRWQVKEEIET